MGSRTLEAVITDTRMAIFISNDVASHPDVETAVLVSLPGLFSLMAGQGPSVALHLATEPQ